MRAVWTAAGLFLLAGTWVAAWGQAAGVGVGRTHRYDVVVVGGTPGGIAAAVVAAQMGRTVVLLERSERPGGGLANGLGLAETSTPGCTGGVFAEFAARVEAHYQKEYGEGSDPVAACLGGYRFEPSVAGRVLAAMMAEEERRLTVRTRVQFDADPGNVLVVGGRLERLTAADLATGARENFVGGVFIDATYEGDLAAAAGVTWRVGREGFSEFKEPLAGQVYKAWGGAVGPGSTGLGDNAVPAYGYRLCLTEDPARRVAVTRPEGYRRGDYLSIADDLRLGRRAGAEEGAEGAGDRLGGVGIGWVVGLAALPNGKVDAGNQPLAFVSTDLPEENWPWPTAGWAWRDGFATRLRDYTLGLLWFCQNDPALPEEFRQRCLRWGLASDEFQDNGNFPRQVGVHGGRRVAGEYRFSAHDALPPDGRGGRPPVLADSVTAAHFPIRSSAARKREPGRVHLDGLVELPSRPYTVPYGVIVPRGIDGLLTPVPVSATHLGSSTLGREPCWMALGHAAGAAAALSLQEEMEVRDLPVPFLQRVLLDQGAVLIHFDDARPGDPHYPALQFFALRGFLGDAWSARLSELPEAATVKHWVRSAKAGGPKGYKHGQTTRGELLSALYENVRKLPMERVERIRAGE